MTTLLTTVFWISCFGVGYTYVLYPVLLFVWRTLKRKPTTSVSVEQRSDRELPSVTVVIAAYNEEAVIGQKISNIRSTDYPGDRIEFLVGSDGSTDRMEQLLQSCGVPSLQVFRFPDRRGKASVLNDLVAGAQGEIIVFSDANTVYEPTTIRRLVGAFSDPSVGGALGELSLVTQGGTLAEHAESFYWRYENALKKLESEIFTTLGGTGPLYAVRRSLFVPLPISKVVTDDFLVPLSVLARGYRVVYEPRARGHEETSASVAREFRRKTRIAVGNYHGISEFYRLLSPRYGFVAFALWSHKILRWMGWIFLLAMVSTSAYVAADNRFFLFVCVFEIVVAALVALGAGAEKLRFRIGMLGMPFHFVAMNAALALGFLQFIAGRRQPTWEVVRHKGS